jgi:dynein heavy chain
VQNYARREAIAVDTLTYSYKVLDTTIHTDITVKPDAGCLIWGMYLEGCKWDYKEHQLG